jgi:hypothetical protein
MRVPDHRRNPRQCRDLLRGPLRVAASNNDLRQRILPLHPPDRGSRILIGGRSHRTGVQQHNVGFLLRSLTQTAHLELPFESGAVRLRSAASEIFYVISSHETILAQA